MMSRFRRESKSAAPRPEPIGEGERSGDDDDDKFSAMHARGEHDSKKKSERGKGNSAGQAECICVRTFFAQKGQSGGGTINEETRRTREKSVRAKAAYDGKNQEQRRKR